MNDEMTESLIGVPSRSYQHEMTLRDYFAGQALVGVLSCEALLLRVDKEFDELATREAAATYAYAIADSMLKAKEQA